MRAKAASFEVLSQPLGLRTSVAVRVRQVRKRGAVRTRQGTERSQQCRSGRAVFATAPCSVIRFRLPMPDVNITVYRGGVQRRRRSRGRRRSGTGSGQRRSRPGGEPATTHQQVVHLREMLLRLAGDFGSFAAELPELLADHGRQQQRAVRFGVQQQVEDLAAGQAEVLRLLRAPRDVDDPEPAPATASAGGSSESSSSSEDDDDDDDGGGDDGAGAGVGAEPGRRGRQGGRRPRSANRRVRRRRARRMREQE